MSEKKFTTTVVWGEYASDRFAEYFDISGDIDNKEEWPEEELEDKLKEIADDLTVSEIEEMENATTTYEFETEKELSAFLDGVNEAVGWLECGSPDDLEASEKLIKLAKEKLQNK